MAHLSRDRALITGFLSARRAARFEHVQQTAQIRLGTDVVDRLGVGLDPLLLGDEGLVLLAQIRVNPDRVKRVDEHVRDVVGCPIHTVVPFILIRGRIT